MNIYSHRISSQKIKPELVLLHGWGSSSDIWQSCLPYLEGYRITLIDLPGLGRSQMVLSHEATLEDWADQVEHLLPENCILVGWSLGGMLAAVLAKRSKLMVRALVTIATAPSFIARSGWEHGMTEEVFSGFEQALQLHAAKTLQRFMLLQVKGEKEAKLQIKQLKASHHEPCHRNLCISLQMLRQDCRHYFSNATVPTLMLLGEFDALVDVRIADQLILQNIDCRVIPGVGHLPILSKPELIATHIKSVTNLIEGQN